MLIRTCQVFAVTAAASLALLGILLFPGLLLGWAVAAGLIGGIVRTWSHFLQPEAGTATRVGALAAGATMALGLAIAGSIVLLGTATVWVLPLLLGLGGLLGWRRRRSWSAAFNALVQPKPAATSPATSSDAGRPAHGHSTKGRHGSHRGEFVRSVPPLLAQLPFLDLAALSTLQLCGTWQRSYWLLLDVPPGPAHDAVVRIRRNVLDELERRDPTGFSRWLQTEPRAGSHPGHYLIADN